MELTSSKGTPLSAKLDMPEGEVKFYAIYAHCFTCSKDFTTTSRICKQLAQNGIAVMRFDFEGLGQSGGKFADSNFSSNVSDIIAVADQMREEYSAPSLLVGHSLGGAAVLAAAGRDKIPELKAVATINAPSEPQHVKHHFEDDHLEDIEVEGCTEVMLGGRPFDVKKQFLEDLDEQDLGVCISKLNKALMIMHAPQDHTVSIEHAAQIYANAKHPKNFISLDKADHLLTNPKDAQYVADVIAAWSVRYVHDSDV